MSSTRLLFDGDCGFCTLSARWLGRHGLVGCDVEAWQRVPEAELPVTPERLMTEIILDRPGLPVLGGADAVAAAIRTAPNRLRVVGVVMAWPGIRLVARVVYRWIARNRHRLPGSTPACELPAEPR